MTFSDESIYDIEPEQYEVLFPRRWADFLERERMRRLEMKEPVESESESEQ